MKRHGRRKKVGRIPGDRSGSAHRSLQYYIEAKDSAGTVVKSSGSQGNPNIIMIEEGVKPVMLASMGRTDNEEPAAEEEAPKAHAARNDDDEEAAPKSGADLKTRPVHKKTRRRSGWFGPSSLRKDRVWAPRWGRRHVGGDRRRIARGRPASSEQCRRRSRRSPSTATATRSSTTTIRTPAARRAREAHLYSQAKTAWPASATRSSASASRRSWRGRLACVVADVVSATGDDHPKASEEDLKKSAMRPVDDEAAQLVHRAERQHHFHRDLAGGFGFLVRSLVVDDAYSSTRFCSRARRVLLRAGLRERQVR